MPTYKLSYFPVRSVGEASRLTLKYAGVDFEDNRIDKSEWPEIKKTMPFGKMPVLEENGKTLCESMAIAFYLAKKHNLAGNDDWEQAKVLEAISYFKDVYAAFGGFIYIKVGYKEGSKEEAQKVGKTAAGDHFPNIEKMLSTNGGCYLVGSKVTVADFFFSDFLYTLINMAPEFFEGHGTLKQYVERVQSLPQIKQYIATRPKSEL